MNSSLDQYLGAIVKLTSNVYYYSNGEKFVYGIAILAQSLGLMELMDLIYRAF